MISDSEFDDNVPEDVVEERRDAGDDEGIVLPIEEPPTNPAPVNDTLEKRVDLLLSAFTDRFTEGEEPPPYPFTLFKKIWSEQGWDSIHSHHSDLVEQTAFVQSIFDAFLDHIVADEPGATQATALFGLDNAFETQPSTSVTPPIFSHIPIPVDKYLYIVELPTIVPEILKKQVLSLLNKLVFGKKFRILPNSNTAPAFAKLSNASYGNKRKLGRPTKHQSVLRRRAVTSRLEGWVDMMDKVTAPRVVEGSPDPDSDAGSGGLGQGMDIDVDPRASVANPTANAPQTSRTKAKRNGKQSEDLPSPLDPPNLETPDVSKYVTLKSKLKAILPRDILRESEEEVRATMKGVEEYAKEQGIVPDNGWRGVQRMQEHKSLLDFVQSPAMP